MEGFAMIASKLSLASDRGAIDLLDSAVSQNEDAKHDLGLA